MENIYQLYGLLANIISDHDCKFNSHFLRLVFKNLSTLLNLSTIDHTEMDGQIEKVNQVLEDMVRAHISKSQSDWEEFLPI